MSRMERARIWTPEEREARSVALDQPHRKHLEDSSDLNAESVLWRACSLLKLREELYQAGVQYYEISMNYKVAIGANAPERGDLGDILSEEEQIARARVAKDRYWAAINVLRTAHPMAQGVVERVCYDHRAPGYSDYVPLREGLYALAVHFGTLRLGINEGKPEFHPLPSYDETIVMNRSVIKPVGETRISPISRWIEANGPVSNFVGAWVKGRW